MTSQPPFYCIITSMDTDDNESPMQRLLQEILVPLASGTAISVLLLLILFAGILFSVFYLVSGGGNV
jgi:hypothetical protein